METVVFHAKRSKNEVNPNHTIAFQKHSDGTIHCTYAKPHNGLDPYSKKFGRLLTTARLNDLNNRLEKKNVDIKIGFDSPRKIKRYVPNSVVTTMHYYLNKAKKVLKIDEERPITLRGQFADWCKYEDEELRMVPTSAVVLCFSPKLIEPKK